MSACGAVLKLGAAALFVQPPAVVIPPYCALESAQESAQIIVQQAREQGKLDAALALLAKTPTGRPLAAQLNGGAVRIVLNDDDNVDYQDGTGVVRYSSEFLDSSADWQNAVILAHELEHARQDRLGVRGMGSRAAREIAAFWVQSRVWMESGGKIRAKDWADNGMNARDMAAWLDYPMSTAAALAARSGWTVAFADDGARAYWDSVRRDESAWRKTWSARFPALDSHDAALFILNQAVEFPFKDPPPVSPWLPDILEAAAKLTPGDSLELPAAATASDVVLLKAAGFVVEGPRVLNPAL